MLAFQLLLLHNSLVILRNARGKDRARAGRPCPANERSRWGLKHDGHAGCESKTKFYYQYEEGAFK